MITSLSNPNVKKIIALRKASKRRKEDLIVIEGAKEIEMAKESDLVVIEAYFAPDYGYTMPLETSVETVSREVFAKMSVRENPDGCLVLARPRHARLCDIKLSKKALVVIMDGVEKPGNVGAILRTIDAVGADALILNNCPVDIYNPNIIRASRGTVFSCQIASAGVKETAEWCKKNKLKTLAASLSAKKSYVKIDLSKSIALVVGAEHSGVGEEWSALVDNKILIPMRGKIDSLNVSVAVGILLYETLRQRGK